MSHKFPERDRTYASDSVPCEGRTALEKATNLV